MNASMIREAVQAHSEALARQLPEADDDVNRTARDVIRAVYMLHGEAWLVSLNWPPKGRAKVRSWTPGDEETYNFCADAVLPCDSPKLRKLIEERDAAEYTGTREDAKRINIIYAEIYRVDGQVLLWS